MMMQNEILELIDGYLDGTADDAGVARLKTWLELDSKNVQSFAHQVFLHQQLRESLLADSVAGHWMSAPPIIQGLSDENADLPKEPESGGKPIQKPVTFRANLGFGFGASFSLFSV